MHQYSELTDKEEQTVQLISKELHRCSVEVNSNYIGATVVIGVITGEKSSPTRALKADIYALSINDKIGLVFSFRTNEQMHAWGMKFIIQFYWA